MGGKGEGDTVWGWLESSRYLQHLCVALSVTLVSLVTQEDDYG